MYCKHCGKLIAEDSKFCQYCGGEQEEKTAHIQAKEKIKKRNSVIVIPTIKTNFSEKTKIWIVAYCAYFILNLAFVFIDGYGNGNEFFPFGYYGFVLRDYDISEFLVYVFLAPLIIYLICKYIIAKKSKVSNSNKSEYTDNNIKNEP